MIHDKKILAVVPARGGSKGVPRKNIRELVGKPLIAWTIEQAKKSRYIDRLIVSTDDEEIARTAKEWGAEVPFLRPVELAQDDTPGVAPVLHAIEKLNGFDYVVLLQPTSPLRRTEDIDGCIEKCVQTGAPTCVTVTLPDKSPYWMYTIDGEQKLSPILPAQLSITRRQDLPSVYVLNGAVYVAKCRWLNEMQTFLTDYTVGYVMDGQRSIDIDTEEDLAFCEWLLNRKKRV
jgi:CMP-N,N'-diacetyllegionaminic acid synthase